jgi:hypothetical protein
VSVAGKSTLTDSLVAAAGIMSVEQVRAFAQQHPLAATIDDRQLLSRASDTAIGLAWRVLGFILPCSALIFALAQACWRCCMVKPPQAAAGQDRCTASLLHCSHCFHVV